MSKTREEQEHLDYIQQVSGRANARGRNEERFAIVAWLRSSTWAKDDAAKAFSEMIERGDHRNESKATTKAAKRPEPAEDDEDELDKDDKRRAIRR